MPESVATRIKGRPAKNNDILALFQAIQSDISANRAAIVAITAKLDADAGVTDTNYAATTNPAALQTLP